MTTPYLRDFPLLVEANHLHSISGFVVADRLDMRFLQVSVWLNIKQCQCTHQTGSSFNALREAPATMHLYKSQK